MSKQIANAIKQAREKSEITQQQLAIALSYRLQRFYGLDREITQQQISKWERSGRLGALELLEIVRITRSSISIGDTLVTPSNKVNSKVLWVLALMFFVDALPLSVLKSLEKQNPQNSSED